MSSCEPMVIVEFNLSVLAKNGFEAATLNAVSKGGRVGRFTGMTSSSGMWFIHSRNLDRFLI
jgi:hypothetical protein